MARISSYNKDTGLSGEDLLVGSSYEGLTNGSPKYITRTYKLSDLAAYFGGYLGDGTDGSVTLQDLIDRVEDLENGVDLISTTVTDNTSAIATAQQSITVVTNELLAQATFQTNLSSTFGTFDEQGNLISLSQAFADQILQTTASDRYANAQFVTNLAASVGTYDANGNLITLGEAFANQVLQVTTTDRFATSEFATNLAASFGTYNPDGTLSTISESFANQLLEASTASDFANATFLTTLASNFGTFDEEGNILTVSQSYADQLLQTANTSEFATSTFATNLASSFGTYDADGNLLTISSSFADDIIETANTAEFAQASALQNLGASFGTVNPDGSVSFDNTSTYSNEVLNYVDANSSLATQIQNLQTTVTNIPQTIRQPNEPDVNAYPLGSIWVDTDDGNSIYILVDGTPRVWEATTSESLGELILSNAQLEVELELLSDTVSSQALKTNTLTAQFGVYDPATNTFTINNNATIISALRTYADAESAAASKVDGINSVFNIVDANGNVIKNLAQFNQEITTYVDANLAITGRIDTLEAEVGDNASAISSEQQARADGDSANATYSFNVASSIGSVDANGNITSVSEAFANTIINTETTATYAAASVVNQLVSTVGDENSGLVASVTETSDTVASLETGLVGKYSLTIGAGDAISSISLLAEDPADPNLPSTSSIIFNTQNFSVTNGTTSAAPFTVADGEVRLNVPLNGVSGSFTGTLAAGTVISGATLTGTLQAGDVSISNSTIDVGGTGSINFNDIGGNAQGSILGAIGALSLTAPNQITLSSGNANVYVSGDIGGVTSIVGNGASIVTGGAAAGGLQIFATADDRINLNVGTNNLLINSDGIFANGIDLSAGGGSTTDTNYYLNGITRVGNTLTFNVVGAADVSYIFGANAFNSTEIPTNNNELVNGAGYITSSALAGLASESWVGSNFVPTFGSTSISGSLTATDFILDSDIVLKENIKEYKVKPINIQYKQYNIIGDVETRVGVIAQELEKDHPEFIRENDKGTKSVSYIDMLVAKVAELEARIKQLEHGATV